MGNFTQANRPARITTPLGTDVLLLKSLVGEEKLGRPFRYEALCLSENPNVPAEDIVGKNVTIKVKTNGGAERFINGEVREFWMTRQHSRLTYYRLVIVPRFDFLKHARDCRIFQNNTQSHKDIITAVLGEYGITPRESLSGTYPVVEFTVQYRESAFDFVSRLMEHNGISYFFEHADGQHTMVLCDSPSAHTPVPGQDGNVRFQTAESTETEQEGLRTWLPWHSVRPDKFTLEDFDWKKPQQGVLRSTVPVNSDFALSGHEVYDYPGLFTEMEEADKLRSMEEDRLVKVREGESASGAVHFKGEGDSIQLQCGFKFTLQNHTTEAFNQEYLTTATTIHIQNAPYRPNEGSSGAKELVYQVVACGQKATDQFRPARLTPQPCIRGPQTAIVVGPDGEEIHTDKFGRVKVRFNWDRVAQADENASCFIRVVHSWAGKKFGAFFLPRIGMEVVVEFLEGDPDRPLITGCVYNQDNEAPMPLPDKATMSGFKSDTSKGHADFNAIWFEDAKDAEFIAISAAKDLLVHVDKDSKEEIQQDRLVRIHRDRKDEIKQDHHLKITRDRLEEIGRDLHFKVVGKQAVEIGGKRSIVAKDDVVETTDKNHSHVITGDHYLKAKNICIEAEENVTIKVGNNFFSLDADGIQLKTSADILFLATGELTAKSMNATIKANSNIALEATANFKAKGTGGVKIESPASTDISGSATKVAGSGMLTLTGGMVSIG